MALNINPLAQLVANVSQSLSQAAETKPTIPSSVSQLDKAALDAKIDLLAGGLPSGLNGANASGVLDTAQTAFGSAQSPTSLTGNTSLSSFADTAQSIAGNLSNVGADISSSLSKLTGGNLATGISDIATGISKSAGVLNNILSLKRGANIPQGGELFKTSGASVNLKSQSADDWRVRITCAWEIFNSPLFKQFEDGGVVFPYQPTISFSTKANYTQIDPVHNNYPFQAYKNSQIDEISIGGKFTAETEKDAAYWISAVTFFKTATKMFFGQGSNVGNPPIVCNLIGYGASIFDNIPVIIKSFNMELPEDVNYVKCNAYSTNTWVPILSTLSITCQPVYNRQNLRQFSLQEYAKGTLKSGGTKAGYL